MLLLLLGQAAQKATKLTQKQTMAQKAKEQQKAAAAIKAANAQEAQKKAAAAAAAASAMAAQQASNVRKAPQSHLSAAAAAAAKAAHNQAAEQQAYSREFQKHSLQRVTHVVQQNRMHEDQLHLLNFTHHVQNVMKNRRNVATCVELSVERAKSLKQEELYKALLIYLDRKGFTPAALHHVRSGPAKCSAGLSEFVFEQQFENKARDAANHMLQLLRAHEVKQSLFKMGFQILNL